jgi:hypothetical protein
MANHSNPERAIQTFFAAMNTHDGDAAAALVDPNVEITLGSQLFIGRDAIRELAAQEDPRLAFETVPVTFKGDSNHMNVEARRVQRWRHTGEIALDEDVQARFSLDSGGVITHVQLT